MTDEEIRTAVRLALGVPTPADEEKYRDPFARVLLADRLGHLLCDAAADIRRLTYGDPD